MKSKFVAALLAGSALAISAPAFAQDPEPDASDATADATAGREVIWGATATGGPPATTITAGTGVSVAAQSSIDWFGLMRISAADTNKFLTGIAAATGLVIEGEGEIGVV